MMLNLSAFSRQAAGVMACCASKFLTASMMLSFVCSGKKQPVSPSLMVSRAPPLP